MGGPIPFEDGALAPLLVKERVLCRQGGGRYGKAVYALEDGVENLQLGGFIARGLGYDALSAVVL